MDRIALGVVNHVKKVCISAAGLFHERGEVLFRTLGEELVLGIVVVNAVAEKYPLGIYYELAPARVGIGSIMLIDDSLKSMANIQVTLTVLVPYDVAA